MTKEGDNEEKDVDNEDENQDEQEEEEEEGDHEDKGEGEAGAEDGSFFESFDRVPSGINFDVDDLPSSSSDDGDEADDVRISFASAIPPPSFCRRNLDDFEGMDLPEIKEDDEEDEEDADGQAYDYNVWMAQPMDMSVSERRRKLLQGMGLASSKNLPLPIPTRAASIKHARRVPHNLPLAPNKSRLPSSRFTVATAALAAAAPAAAAPVVTNNGKQPAVRSPVKTVIARSRSDTELSLPPSTSSSSEMAALFRVSSAPPSQWQKWAGNRNIRTTASNAGNKDDTDASLSLDDEGENDEGENGELKIKNLDTGKEFVISTTDSAITPKQKGGKPLTMDEFEKFIGFSPIIKDVMRRVTASGADGGKGGLGSKSSKNGKPNKKKANWLKNIKFVAGLKSDREASKEKSNSSSERLKVHQHGKSYKEMTGLYMCQEIQAHQGSIWTMKFSSDSRYLASAGEDRIVSVWRVVERDTLTSSLHRQDQPSSPSKQPPLGHGGSSSLSISKRMKKGKGSGGVPDYIVIPETMFSLSAEPICSLKGHSDDVLDLSWSKSQYLLSSSMDKTVRLWDIETKTCVKMFAHSDYVTCIQFNPTDERYFISGSLDAKVRLWSVPDRLVVDWTDIHEMVTATCYTPDGQGALVGSHKGSCRFYNTSDAKLSQERQIEARTKKKKSNAKKITGLQFAPDNSSEVLITSADSQIRVFDGENMIHKFRGFRNTSSQISASCTMDGKYVVCASEDSHVYIWKRDRPRGKGKATTRSHEHFFCKDVSVAVPWPNGGLHCEPFPDLPSWSRPTTDRSASNLQDMFPSSRSHNSPAVDSEEANGSPRVIESSSLLSGSASLRSGQCAGSSMSASVTSSSSSFSSWGWGAGAGNKVASAEDANAWGLVVVTAGLGGNIRVYQNFGVPLRLRGQF